MFPRNHIYGMRRRYTQAIEDADRLCRALAHLRYEGKIHFGSNLKETTVVFEGIECEASYHMKMEDDVLFPFLNTHVPKLAPMIKLLQDDHQNTRFRMGRIKKMLGELESARSNISRYKLIAFIKSEGIWLVFMLRYHMQSELESIYPHLDNELHREEIRELEKKLGKWLKFHPCRCHAAVMKKSKAGR